MNKRSAPAAFVPKLGGGRRRAPRVPAAWACELVWNDNSASGSLIDLSTTGAAVGLGAQLPLQDGDHVRLEFGTADRTVVIEAALIAQSEETYGTFVARLNFFQAEGDSADLDALVAENSEIFRGRQVAVFRRHL